MVDFSKVDFSSDEFLFAYQELGEFETENAGKFKEIKAYYKDFLDKFGIPHEESASFMEFENIFVELAQEFVAFRTRRVNEFTQRRLQKNAGK